VLTDILRDHRICSSARGDGDFSDPKAWQHPRKAKVLLPCVLFVGGCCPSWALPLGAHLLPALDQNRETLTASDYLKLEGKMDI